MDSMAIHVESLGFPVELMDIPLESFGMPMKSMGIPMDSLGIPVASLGTPIWRIQHNNFRSVVVDVGVFTETYTHTNHNLQCSSTKAPDRKQTHK